MERTSRIAVWCGTILVLAATVSAQPVKPGVATIVRIQGEARYTLRDGSWYPLVVGKTLGAGAVIETLPGATVDMVLGRTIDMPQAAPVPDRIGPAPDPLVRGIISYKPSVEQNMVRMTGGTMMAIDKLTISDTGLDTVSDTELDLWKGRIFCSVKKLSAASQYFVKIPNGIAGVRGTLFGIDASGWCAVLKSSVGLAIVGPDNVASTYTIGEGNQFDPKTGQVTPVTPELHDLLTQTSDALDTAYVLVLSYAYDGTFVFISPVSGRQ